MNNNFKIVNINSITDVFIKNSNIQYTWVQYSLKEQAVLYAEIDIDKTSVYSCFPPNFNSISETDYYTFLV